MMRIVQILNNNVALVSLGDRKQAIVMGKGVAFKKKMGDSMSSKKIEKIFYLESKESQDNLSYLLKDIPLDIVTTTFEIIDNAKEKYQFSVLDYIYITLSDHIYGAYQIFEAGKYKASLVPDMHEQYPVEYQIAKDALKIINKNLHIRLPDSEMQNIALHFINAKGTSTKVDDVGQKNREDANSVVQTVFKQHHIIRTEKNRNFYDRLMIHMQYLMDRIDNQETGNTNFMTQLKDELMENYPKSAEIAEAIFVELERRLNLKLSNNEKMYFVIHIQRLINEKSKN